MRSLRVLALVLPCLTLAACGDKDVTPIPTDDSDDEQLLPNLVVSSRALDFGVLDDVGDSAQTQIVVENTGVGDLELVVTLSAPFSATQSTVVLLPQSSLQFTVYYAPKEYGEAVATMLLASNDPDEPEIAVALTGAVATDADADGYIRIEAGGDDCDDDNPDINPGAVDEYYDNIDANCDGLSDWDQDQDGYIAKAKEPNPDKGGGDCNDLNADIFPGGPDVWYDGVDGDCAGDNDYDQDGDTYGSKAYGKGSDCDDTDAEAYPDALERLNGKLDNCNGATDQDVATSSATTRYNAKSSATFFGYSAAVGDIDGDGKDDLAVGARGNAGSAAGAVYLFMSKDGLPADGSTVDKASDSFVGLTSTEGLGTAMHYFDDFEGDGVAELVVGGYYGSSYYGGLYLIDVDRLAGKTGGLGDAHTTVKGSSSGYYVGRSVARADLNADGLDDLLFDYSPTSSAAPTRATSACSTAATAAPSPSPPSRPAGRRRATAPRRMRRSRTAPTSTATATRTGCSATSTPTRPPPTTARSMCSGAKPRSTAPRRRPLSPAPRASSAARRRATTSAPSPGPCPTPTATAKGSCSSGTAPMVTWASCAARRR
jgi:hypothetical protein